MVVVVVVVDILADETTVVTGKGICAHRVFAVHDFFVNGNKSRRAHDDLVIVIFFFR